MTFKDAMAHYRAGTATPEERKLVEEELEKSQLVADYLDEQWAEEPLPPLDAPAGEIQQVRKKLRRHSLTLVLTSVALAAALLLGTIYGVIPALEKQYWDPNEQTLGQQFFTDFDITLDAYAELFCPELTILQTFSKRTGFASHELNIRYELSGQSPSYAIAQLERDTLTLPMELLDQSVLLNIFERGSYPTYPDTPETLSWTRESLEKLPDFVSVTAAVSFSEDWSMDRLLAFASSLDEQSHIGWVGIRHYPSDIQFYPLCGIKPFEGGTVLETESADYPFLNIKGIDSLTAEQMQQHFLSQLRWSLDRTKAGRGIPIGWHDPATSYYESVIDYVEENGMYTYGCYLTTTPQNLLRLLDEGVVSKIFITDKQIG